MYQPIAIVLLILDLILIHRMTQTTAFDGKNWIGFKSLVISRKNGLFMIICILSAMGFPALELTVKFVMTFFQ